MASSSTPTGSSRTYVWLLALAALLIVLGLFAMSALSFSACVFIVVLGWLLIGGGVLQIASAFLYRSFGGFGVEIFFGALSIALGAVLVAAPVTTGSLIALLVVIGLIADAVLEAVRALLARRPGWIWPVLIALVAVGLGVAILFRPTLLLVLLGFLVGVSLLVRGVILLLAALELRQLAR